MRVLVTADTVGGVWTYTRELVTGLTRQGHEVVLVSLGGMPTDEQASWINGLPRLAFYPTAYKLEWMQDSANDLKASQTFLSRLIAKSRPDLLHFSQYCYGALECDIPKVVVAHSDVVSWQVAVHGEEPGPEPWIEQYREVVMKGLAGADAVVGVTSWMLRQIETHYAGPVLKKVIYNGRNPRLFSPDSSKQHYAVSVGRLWDPAKQVNLLLEIDAPPPIRIAGGERHPESGASSAAKARKRGVEFLGVQSEEALRELYSRASIYIATSRYEPFGLAAVEAALSGCAILANDIESLREVWGD
ncbi:MAG: glycosyltransferase family 4 protein, partial [Acidobacteriaceae bacterium]